MERKGMLAASRTVLGGVTFLPAFRTFQTARVALIWIDALLQIIRTTNPAVTIVARALAVVATCMYDAWSAYDPVASSTCCGKRLTRPVSEHTQAHKEEAISYAAYRALKDLFPDQELQFRIVMGQLGYSTLNQSEKTNTPAGIGNMMARLVLDFRHNDGSNQLGTMHAGAYADYTNYQPINTTDTLYDPNKWQPLGIPHDDHSFVVQRFVTPHWGHVKPFALFNGSQFRPAVPPATVYSSRYGMQANQLLDISANLTDQQKVIAEYWQDGPDSEQAPGHWFLIAQYVVRRDMYNLDAAIKLFFVLGNALLDASIVCWDCKRAYNSVRPITAIHSLYAERQVLAWAGPDQGTKLLRGADWRPYQTKKLVTPASPEYCSGHSTFSAASATILALFTGSDYFGGSYTRSAGSSLIEPGTTPKKDVTLAWKTFSAAAIEAGISRLYAGVHFEQGNFTGRALGHMVAQIVWAQAQKYLCGTI
ncbi:hypothetical protein KDA_22370 [Dictyobacter alpinus]|uniref:Uncharacterized protein n=1 Tax=Dictyobacter alpinus TaxID=2014873 RepID=A0A402B5X5_9CHLR|nr:vanadium-dependent haloperoxidase [Dictyobacter alpinus]GCE26753.1 hypothetical protein KDA_22370 [Dictyobacter alpinus]